MCFVAVCTIAIKLVAMQWLDEALVLNLLLIFSGYFKKQNQKVDLRCIVELSVLVTFTYLTVCGCNYFHMVGFFSVFPRILENACHKWCNLIGY